MSAQDKFEEFGRQLVVLRVGIRGIDRDRTFLQLCDQFQQMLPLGLRPAPASQLACRILGERIRSSADDIAAVCSARKGPVPSF